MFFTPSQLQTRTVQLRELTIRQAHALAQMPDHLLELATTNFLRSVVESPSSQEDDPLYWTVEERMMGIAHYLANQSAQSGASMNFEMGDKHFLDYFMPDSRPRIQQVEAGEVLEKKWVVRQLTGRMAESIERLGSDLTGGLTGRARWQFGRLACQMVSEEDAGNGFDSDAAFDLWLGRRFQYLIDLSESDLMALMIAYETSRLKLQHLFLVGSDELGLVALCKGGQGAASARFRAVNCTSEWIRTLSGKPHESES